MYALIPQQFQEIKLHALKTLIPSLGNKILVSESPMGNYFKA